MTDKRHRLGGDPVPPGDDPEPLPLPPLPELEMSWDSEVIAAGRGHQFVRSNFSEKPEQWSGFFHDDPWGVHRTIGGNEDLRKLIEDAIRAAIMREMLEQVGDLKPPPMPTREQLEIDWINRDKIDAVDEAEERLPGQRFGEGPGNWGVAMLPMPGNGDNVVPILERIERMMQEVIG